jgi:hypothetical protein
MDECLFNVDSKRPGTWQKRAHPIHTIGKWSNKKVVVVCGAISPSRGAVYFMYGYRSFNSMDMVEMMKQIRAHSKP